MGRANLRWFFPPLLALLYAAQLVYDEIFDSFLSLAFVSAGGDAVTTWKIKDVLRESILGHFEIGADDHDFSGDVDYGFVDSLGATEIVLFLEDHFNIQITQKDITLYSMNTIVGIAEVVEWKLS